MRAPLSVFLTCALVVVSAAQAPVIVVAKAAGPGVDFTSINAAVQAAPEGGVVLIRAGTYDELRVSVTAKSLILTADTGALVVLRGRLQISGLAATQSAVVRGIECRPAEYSGYSGLEIQGCVGPVWIEGTNLYGAVGSEFIVPTFPTPGCKVSISAAVSFAKCQIEGGSWFLAHHNWPGAAGLECSDSTVAMHGGSVVGGPAIYFGSGGGLLHPGGPGAKVTGGSLFAERTAFLGGAGDACFPPPTSWPVWIIGPGGPAIHLSWGDPVATLFGAQVITGIDGCGAPSAPWIKIDTGSVVTLPGTPRAFQVPSPLREGDVASLTFSSVAGDLALLGLSFEPAHLPLVDLLSGVLHLGPPLDVIPMGVVPLGGSLTIPVVVPELGAGVEAFPWRLQAAFLSADFATAVLADPAAPVLLDAGL